jgi:hypothetical protein
VTRPRTYRMLGHDRVVLTRRDVEALVREGLLDPNTLVFGDGESFAVPIAARAEFRHLTSVKITREGGKRWTAIQGRGALPNLPTKRK